MIEVPDHVAISFFTTYANGEFSSGVYRTRCMMCGDSQKRKHIKRLYLYKKGTSWNLFCHNCDYSRSFLNFVKEEYSEHFDDILNQCKDYSHAFESSPRSERKPRKETKKKINTCKIFIQNECVPLSLDCGDKSKQEVVNQQLRELLNRKIKVRIIKKMFFCNGKRYTNRVIIPFYDAHGDPYYFQAKSTRTHQSPKYINWRDESADGSVPKPEYNEFHIDREKIVYIVEGLFDSTFVKNAISTLGVSMSEEKYEYYCDKYPNHVFIMDNDERGWEKMRWLFEKGDRCVLFPFEFKHQTKDLNELALELNVSDLTDFVIENTYDGLVGSMKMDEYKIDRINNKDREFKRLKEYNDLWGI